MIIRNETFSDHRAIHRINAGAFPSDAEARLVDALRAAGDLTISLVALDGNQLIGHVACSPVTTHPDIHLRGMGLAPLAVMEAHRRRGVGAALVQAAISACREQQFDFLVVLGDTSYYRRFGFELATKLGLANEYNADEHFMAMALKPGALAGAVASTVRYAPAFAAL